ncbi:aspartate/glutamate racemase family protein [Gynuella sp.]|uniref:aspartate/glutamate racemase family protein n=1 Tax=Gynuella sp. TaxID=2969146 RepID=UPI003D0C8F2C
MAIIVINPNSSTSMTRQLEQECQQLDGLHHEIYFETCNGSPSSIEGHSDGAIATFYLLEKIRAYENNLESSHASAYVIACFDDTGLEAARELTNRPVIGIGEAAMHAASLLSHRFCIMTTLQRSVPILQRNLDQYGLTNRCAGVFASNIPVLQLDSNPDSYDRVLAAARTTLQHSHGEALILGCAGMSQWVRAMEQDLGMPVLDGVRIAIKFAESLIDLKLMTSKVGSYRYPELKTYD